MPGSFGEYVAQRRQAKGLSVRQLAARVNVAPSTITRIENGSTPHPDLLTALIDVLDLDVTIAVRLVEPYRRLYRRITDAGKEG